MKSEQWKTWPLPEGVADLDEWQAGRCAWCGYDLDALVRDHCHMTGLVRGLLCSGCNTREGTTAGSAWDSWRSGDNPAWALKHFEIYVNHLGSTPYSSRSALHYYSPAERQAWFTLAVDYLRAGRMQWPTNAPWIDTAIERREADRRLLHEAMADWDFLTPRAAT